MSKTVSKMGYIETGIALKCNQNTLFQKPYNFLGYGCNHGSLKRE